ncbi:MAG: 16S rRNA (cytidine(1402)-2'-O)-methyltransferase [Clostridia bacterium]|nr:16S rRNA (cytidine(1402)-2'-O)-methyltransferase [Clostridia bacterium]
MEGLQADQGGREKGRLYLCATPIGNLEDITLRVLRVLKEVDLIAAEDTRHTRKLLTHFDIHTPLTSYHQHNEAAKSNRLVEDLLAGKQVALVSDAGMPGISDPGYYLIRAALEAGIEVIPLPGPSAALTALVVSGLSTDRFAFEGFLPGKKKERQLRLSRLAEEDRTIIFYEAPHRLTACLSDLAAAWGERQAAVVRELTKIHEEAVRGPLSRVLAHFQENPPKGEFVIVVEGAGEDVQKKQEAWEGVSLEEHLRKVMATGLTKKEAIKEVASQRGLSKREVYKLAVELD